MARTSLCDPNTVKHCTFYGGQGEPSHTSVTCYVRSVDLSGEPGDEPFTYEEWSRI